MPRSTELTARIVNGSWKLVRKPASKTESPKNRFAAERAVSSGKRAAARQDDGATHASLA
jgi:hypothetical protein